jgi:hypothetical protein
VKSLTDHLERRFRVFLYATTSLVFGEAGYVKEMPDEVRKYAYRNLEEPGYSAVANAYDGFSRGQYRSVFANGSRVKDLVIDAIPIEWAATDWGRFLDIFVEENVKTSHQKVSYYDVSDRDRYFNYSRMAEELMAHLNDLGHHIPFRAFVVIQGSSMSPEDAVIKYHFKRLKPDQDRELSATVRGEVPAFLAKAPSTDHPLSRAVYEKVCEQIQDGISASSTKCVDEDLLDVDYLVTHYAVTYQEFVNSVVFGWRVDRRFSVGRWFGSSVRPLVTAVWWAA